MSLRGAVCVVTGAASGIGAAVVRALADDGAMVVLVDVDPAVTELAAAHRGEPVVTDLTDAARVEGLLDAIVERHDRLDVLVNNAGLARHNAVAHLRPGDIDLMWDLNVRAPMLLCRDAMRLMGSGGQIVNVVSTAGLQGGAGESAYNATKFALRGFTQALAEEARLTGVRVHGIYPAGVDTGFWPAATDAGPGVDPAACFLRAEDVAAAVRHAVSGPPHVHLPELVIRAVTDGDTDATRAKLAWFRS